MYKRQEDDWLAVVREGHPRAGSLDLDAIVELPHVMHSVFGGTRAELDRILDAQGKKRRVAVTAPNFHAMWRTVCSTDMVAMLPRRFAQGLPGIHAVPHPAELAPIRLCLWWHKPAMTNPRLDWFRGLVLDTMRT